MIYVRNLRKHENLKTDISLGFEFDEVVKRSFKY